MRRAVILPGLPRFQKIQAGPEPVLCDNKVAALGNTGKPLRHIVVPKKHMARFLQPVITVEVDITKPGRFRHTLSPDQFCGLDSGRQN